jgi:phage terminase small subunit
LFRTIPASINSAGIFLVVKKVAKTRVKAGTSKASAADKRTAFVEAYFANGENGTQAAITAGFAPKSAGVTAAKLLKDPRVLAEIANRRTELIANLELSTERTLKEVSRLAFCDPRKLIDENGKLKSLHELDDDTAAAIASVEVDKDGGIKYKFWDKNSAIEKAAKIQGLYKKDNEQKTDPLTSLLHSIAGGSGSAFKPVANDPERTRDGKAKG